MTLPEATEQARAGQRITRPGRKSWLEFYPVLNTLIINGTEGVPCRWTPIPADVEANDWYLLKTEVEIAIEAERERCLAIIGHAIQFPGSSHAEVLDAVLAKIASGYGS